MQKQMCALSSSIVVQRITMCSVSCQSSSMSVGEEGTGEKEVLASRLRTTKRRMDARTEREPRA